MRIERGAAALDLEPDAAALPRGAAATLTGFADLPRTSWFVDTCRIRLVYRSGRLQTVHEGPPGGFSGAVAPGFAPRLTRDAVEGLAHARLAMDRPDPTSAVEDFGAAEAGPPGGS